MSLESKIANDLKEAMINKDAVALRSIRSIKAAILLFKTDGSGNALDESAETKMLQKLVKQRQDSLDIYEKQGREDLAEIERQEIKVIQKYLPEQLSEDELKTIIQGIIHKMGANSMKDMGKVIGEANVVLAGKSEGKIIANVVKQLLG